MNIPLRNSLTVLLLAAASTGALAEQNKVASPDGRLVVNVEDRDGRLYYDISYDSRQTYHIQHGKIKKKNTEQEKQTVK